MTAVINHVDTPSAVVQPDDSVKPKRKQVAFAIRGEMRASGFECSKRDADDLLDMLAKAVHKIRTGHGIHHLDDDDLTQHRLLETVMPDDRVVAPTGSAQELINRYFCRSNELGLVHTNTHPSKRAENCAVRIQLEGV